MVTAFVMIQTRRDAINETAEALTKLDGVAEVYSVAGEWDLVAVIRVATNDEMAEVVTSQMLKMDGITRTSTAIAFRAYSRFDLDRMFSIGFEKE